MSIVRFEPFRDLMSLQDRMNRLFDQSHPRQRRRLGPGRILGAGGRHLREGRQHRPQGRAAGHRPEDVDVRVENNVLTLRGERKFEEEVKKDDFHRVERAYGTFTRSFTLPALVDTEKIKAEFKDGVLKLTIPKKEEAKPKQIQIQVQVAS